MEVNKDKAWEMLTKAIAEIVLECGCLPVPIYKEYFKEGALTRPGTLEMIEAGELEVTEAKAILEEKKVDTKE